MTDVKISQLPVATLPLTGTEVFPLVQNNVTVKAAVGAINSQTANIAALRTVPPSSFPSIYVLGYYTSGDGGEGVFFSVTGASPGTYTDNNGTIIVPTGGDGSSAWVRETDGTVDVRWFGAKGDGITDDSAAIQAAINSNNSIIYYSKGTYLINTPLVIRSFQQHVGQQGALKSSGVIFTQNSLQQYVVFDGLSLLGPGKAFSQTNTAIYSNSFTFRNCQFSNELSTCIEGTFLLSLFEDNLFGANTGVLGATNQHLIMTGSAVSGLAINNNIIRRNRFFRAKGSYALFIQYGSTNIIEQNDFEECTATPVYVDGGGQTIVRENWFENNSTPYQCVFLSSAAITFNIYDNRVIDFRDNNFLLLSGGSNTAVVSLDLKSYNLSISNNSFYSTAPTTITVGVAGALNAGIVFSAGNDYFSGVSNSGAEKISNGAATSGTTGWTPFNGTLAAISGGGPTGGNYFSLTATSGSSQYFFQLFTGLTVGTTYTVSYFIRSGTSGNESAQSSIINSYTKTISSTTTAAWVKITYDFVALDTFETIRLIKNSATIGTMHFSDISFTQKYA